MKAALTQLSITQIRIQLVTRVPSWLDAASDDASLPKRNKIIFYFSMQLSAS